MQKSKSSTNVSQAFSKTIHKSRSKSHSRTNSPSQQNYWLPTTGNGDSTWYYARAGRTIRLKKTNVLCLTTVEHRILRELAYTNVYDELKVFVVFDKPIDISDGPLALMSSSSGKNSSNKKRGPILLKRKAKTTSFFDTNKSSAEDDGFYFGKTLESCIESDLKLTTKAPITVTIVMPMGSSGRSSRNSITSLTSTGGGGGGGGGVAAGVDVNELIIIVKFEKNKKEGFII